MSIAANQHMASSTIVGRLALDASVGREVVKEALRLVVAAQLERDLDLAEEIPRVGARRRRAHRFRLGQIDDFDHRGLDLGRPAAADVRLKKRH